MWEWETSVMLIRDSSGRVLLVRQAYGLRLFGLPGGQVEPGETPEQAAVREVREETGLMVSAAELLSVEDLVYPGTGRRYRAYVFACDRAEGEPAVGVPGEISSIGWYDLDNLPSPLTPSAAAALAQVRERR
ncbi:NUDIX hydrolase [Allorhizocola rhizosphaerae]|uniref:NUDIX hydrolase n=1 Tax=Allorhizocola rhizosphaerae TaxID=1872709 RepID=UPI000E3E839C|nr:NUDIX hydrolase [Allorhizocola rhizosphaerae]